MQFFNATGIRTEEENSNTVLILSAEPKGNTMYHDEYKFYIYLKSSDVSKLFEFVDNINDNITHTRSRLVKVYIDNYRYNQYLSPITFSKDINSGCIKIDINIYDCDTDGLSIKPIHNVPYSIYFDSTSETELFKALFA